MVIISIFGLAGTVSEKFTFTFEFFFYTIALATNFENPFLKVKVSSAKPSQKQVTKRDQIHYFIIRVKRVNINLSNEKE